MSPSANLLYARNRYCWSSEVLPVTGGSAFATGGDCPMNHCCPPVRLIATCFLVAFFATLSRPLPCRGEALDLTAATVVALGSSKVEKKAVAMLIEEVRKRTDVSWSIAAAWPAAGRSVIVVGKESDLSALAGRFAASLDGTPAASAAEGFRIRICRDDAGAAVFVLGSDDRGVLFGVGRMLRAAAHDAGQDNSVR